MMNQIKRCFPLAWRVDAPPGRVERFIAISVWCYSGSVFRYYHLKADNSNEGRNKDKSLSYAEELSTFGLFYQEHVDGVHLGDGVRMLLWWCPFSGFSPG